MKVAEGCDRACGFCAIPSFRGPQRSRPPAAVLEEVSRLVDPGGTPAVREIVLVAQDLVSFGRDRGTGARPNSGLAPIVSLLGRVSELVDRVRVLYIYPSGLTDELVDAIVATGVPYFDLSLQHVSRPLLVKMRRWGDGDRFLRRIEQIRRADPLATLRSSFIVGYPGEREEDHDRLLEFLRAADLDWAGFFPFSPEDGTPAVDLPDQVPSALAMERLRECGELQDTITPRRHATRWSVSAAKSWSTRRGGPLRARSPRDRRCVAGPGQSGGGLAGRGCHYGCSRAGPRGRASVGRW